MRARTVLSPVAWIGLAGAGVLPLLMPQTLLPGGNAFAAVAAPPPYIAVTGIVRDFSRDHPDFNVVPLGGYGHFAGNIDLNAGVDGRPVLVGGGFKVATQWTDRDVNNIAPHLYTAGVGGLPGEILVVNPPELIGGAEWDTYDSSTGPYGPGNEGGTPDFVIGATMPTLTEPTGLPPLVDVVEFPEIDGTVTTDIHCNKFLVKNCTVTITGNITMLVENEVSVIDQSELLISDGSSLTLYVKGSFLIKDSSAGPTSSANPEAFTIYNLGTKDIEFIDQSGGSPILAANIISPNARLYVKNSEFFGGFIGLTAAIDDQADAHFDEAYSAGGIPALDACSVAFDDTAGGPGITSSGGISSSPTFDEWFRDVLGTNLSTYVPIALFDNGSGVYEYLDDDFHPIDGMLLGNEGDPNNNYFTFVIGADFTYQACASQFFQFRGADDAWLFVDGKLAIDLGGVLPLMDQHVDMDRLGLTDGQTYRMLFFYAHRQPGPAMFRMRTNLDLDSLVPSISAAFD